MAIVFVSKETKDDATILSVPVVKSPILISSCVPLGNENGKNVHPGGCGYSAGADF